METIDIEKAVAELNAPREQKEISFIVKDDFEKNLPQIISNCEELKVWAIETTKADKALILQSQEDFDKAEKRCADINRIIKTIDTKRKEVKKAYTEPYEVFEGKLKEVTATLNEARDNLWGQIKAAETAEKEAKETEYRTEWESLESAKYRSWEQVFNPKWVNRTTKREAVRQAISELAEITMADIGAIRTLNSDFEVSLIDYYKQGHSISEVIAYNNRLAEQNKALSAEKTTERTNSHPEEEKPVKTEISASEQIEEETLEIDFRVYATKTQLQALKQFLVTNKIKYGKVPTQGE